MTKPEDREVDMSQYEVEDDEELDQEELKRITDQGVRSRAALVYRSAAKGKSPMGMFADGEVTVEIPDDTLVRRKDRQLPHAAFQAGVDESRPSDSSVGLTPPVSIPEDSLLRNRARPPTTTSDPMGDRMRAWMAENGAQHVAEGFNSYFKTPPRAREEAVPQPVTPVDDNEVAEAEIVGAPVSAQPYEDEDIVDAEIVEGP